MCLVTSFRDDTGQSYRLSACSDVTTSAGGVLGNWDPGEKKVAVINEVVGQLVAFAGLVI